MVLDAVVAQNEAQRGEMWGRREAAAEISISKKPIVGNDIAVPIDKVATFLARIDARLPDLDNGAEGISVTHLGEGNIHYTVYRAPRLA
jgi:FAD/FMN-containing dehydrogenase